VHAWLLGYLECNIEDITPKTASLSAGLFVGAFRPEGDAWESICGIALVNKVNNVSGKIGQKSGMIHVRSGRNSE
jgi:hypothetical protein